VERDTERRDKAIAKWVEAVNKEGDADRVTYTVLTDCHHQEYKRLSLDYKFATVPVLANLAAAYPESKEMTRDEVLFCDDRLTYIAVVRGFVPGDKSRPLLMRKKDNIRQWDRYSKTEEGEGEEIMISSDYLKWLMRVHNFQVTGISHVYFHRKCDSTFNDIFKGLTEARSITEDETKKQLFKKIQNLSCGFFGYNSLPSHQNHSSFRLVAKMPRTFVPGTREVEEAGEFGNNYYFFVGAATRARPTVRKPSHNALPMFVGIVETGKMRVAQILCFLDKHLVPGSHRHLYTNVDNVVLALAAPDLDSAVHPKNWNKYAKEKLEFFAPGRPGHLKEEFALSREEDDWKFISHMTHHWCVLTREDEKCRQKSSSFNGVGAQKSYEIALALLEKKKISLEQVRRTNKLKNMETKKQTFNFKPK